MLIRYLEFAPAVAPPFECAPKAAIVGRTTVGPGLVLRDYATLRADGEAVRIGANAYFGERATVHIADRLLPANVGDDVTVGRYALVHACTVEDGVVVGDTAVVMDGAHVGAGAVITAGSLVPPRKRLAGGWIYDGNPATPVREVASGELAAAASAIRARSPSQLVSSADVPAQDVADVALAGPGHDAVASRVGAAYVAPTALLVGDVDIADDAGVYFGCVLAGGGARITIGPRTNVQDNSLLVTDAARGALAIGADVTIGHNVRMGAAVIGDHALVGMGAQLGDGVVVEEGGCIGARSWVEPGTVVARGWIWAGRPARAFRELKAPERQMFAESAQIYVRYAAAYRTVRRG